MPHRDLPASARPITPADAARLVGEGRARLLDLRSTPAGTERRYVPGAIALPMAAVASAPAVLEADGRPLIVCAGSEADRVRAVEVLARAGFDDLVTADVDPATWPGPLVDRPTRLVGPSSWLLGTADLLPTSGHALDVASGRGRHALTLASWGLTVDAVDADPGAVADLARAAGRLGLPVRADVRDLERDAPDLGSSRYDAIVCVHYLHRPLVPALRDALAPGGVLLYETFTTAQAARGRPTNPAHLLQPGELERLVAPLRILRAREGEFEGRDVAAVAARRPGGEVD